jgi:hypothetical protein
MMAKKDLLRDIVIALLSLLTVIGVVTFFVEPSYAAVSVDDTDVTPISAPHEVVAGVVRTTAGSIKLASVTVERQRASSWVTTGKAAVGADGSYRVVLRACHCALRVKLTVVSKGRRRAAIQILRVSPYHSYRVDFRMYEQRSLIFLPAASY